MATTVPVTARSGERLRARVQTKTARHGFDEATGEPKLGWVDAKIEEFASETRHFEIVPDQVRLVIESVATPSG